MPLHAREVPGALGRLDPAPHDVIGALVPAREDRHPYVHWNVAWALGQICVGRAAVLNALATLREDGCDDVRKVARRAFRAIEVSPERASQWQPVSIKRGG